ncbi:MAG: KH domain-containing protein [Erysipelotrichaceae bacterium]|nr:KH domain-containing protein [Erysipelotrichaceae bacterium]MDD3923548.1 KH domain-containing protein [Erysipelotrichaceae bacterium]MDD4642770.1 KH domain-containing protein [Erysipelotrichaceae bacterium]
MDVFSAKTLEDLLSKAAEEKKVTVDDLQYFVIEEKKGFLGLGNQVSAEVYSLNDVSEFIANYLEKFFKGLNLAVDIVVTKENDIFRVMLNAENNAIIIGKNGQTLQALNTVVKGATNSTFKHRFRILVDINNYKTDRYDKVKAIAYRVATSVQKTRISAVLDPIPNDERRVIHNYLSELPHIRTESEGEGRARRIRIIYDEDKK